MLNYQEIKGMDKKVLEGKLSELRRGLFKLKMDKNIKKQSGGLKKSHEIRAKRRDVARVLTAIRATKEGTR